MMNLSAITPNSISYNQHQTVKFASEDNKPLELGVLIPDRPKENLFDRIDRDPYTKNNAISQGLITMAAGGLDYALVSSSIDEYSLAKAEFLEKFGRGYETYRELWSQTSDFSDSVLLAGASLACLALTIVAGQRSVKHWRNS